MTDVVRIGEAMAGWPGLRTDGQRVMVPTHCLYPSNAVVVVVVEGRHDVFRVHDDGRAVDEYLSAGATSLAGGLLGSVRYLARQQGLEVSGAGVIQAPLISFAQVATTVALVANLSKEAAHHMADRFRPAPRRDLRQVVEEMLDRQFPRDWKRDRPGIPGQSNKPHKFDYVVNLPRERMLLLDVVAPEASSINAAVVSHLDVRNAHRPDIEQRIIYDDRLPWKAPDLSLLSVGAKAVPLSHAQDVLQRLAA